MSAIKNISSLAFLFTIVLFSNLANANYYAGAIFSYTATEYTHSSSTSSQNGHPLVLQAQLGYFFNDYIALEGRYGVSTGRSGGLSIDSLASVLLKGNLPVTDQVAMYALLGGSSAKLDQQNVGSSTDTGTSFGLGVHYALGRNNAVTLEYLSSLTTDKTKLGGINLAYQYRF